MSIFFLRPLAFVPLHFFKAVLSLISNPLNIVISFPPVWGPVLEERLGGLFINFHESQSATAPLGMTISSVPVVGSSTPRGRGYSQLVPAF